MLSKVFKILGKISDKDGAGVVGHNTAESGTAIGVEGKTESDEGYGVYTEDDTYVEGEMRSGSVCTDRVSISERLGTDSVPHVVYVRSDGDDSNDGQTVSTAVASISKAVEKVLSVPLQAENADLPSHVIDIEAGQSFTLGSRLAFSTPWTGMLRFRSSSSGSQATIHIGSGITKGIQIETSRVSFKNIRIDAADAKNRPEQSIQVHHESDLEVRGKSLITGATKRQIDVDHCSTAEIRRPAIIEGQGPNDGSSGVRSHGCSFVVVTGTIKNTARGIWGTRQGAFAVEGGTIDNCGTAMQAADGVEGKVADNGTVSNCTLVAEPRGGGSLKLSPTVNLSGNTAIVGFEESFGQFRDNRTDSAKVGAVNPIAWVDSTNNTKLRIGNHGIWPGEKMNWRHLAEDLTVRSPAWCDEVAFHDGSGTPSHSLCFSSGNKKWYNIVDGNTF